MKATVYTLFRAFQFELAILPEEIQVKTTAVSRPYLKDNIQAGAQLPVWVTPLDDDRP